MEVSVNNIAKIREAKLVCQGLTAIIGDNDKGKSTIGKVLYSIFHTFQDLKAVFLDVQAGYVLESLNLRNTAYTRRFFRSEWFLPDAIIDDGEFDRRFALHSRHGFLGPRYSVVGRSFVSEIMTTERERELKNDIKIQIQKVRGISQAELLHDAIQADLNKYFKNQFLPNYPDANGVSEVSITVKGRTIAAWWNSTDKSSVAEDVLHNDAWFIGTPLIMDSLGASIRVPSYSIDDSINRDLISKLRRYRPGTNIAKRIADAELASVYELIEGYFSGEFLLGKNGELEVGIPGMQKPLNSANLSMGIKMLALLRLMIDANLLKRKDVLILDEPENHLHPELQVLFADVIVELQRIYDLTVLVTTHSPYFLQSLELSARKKRAENGEGETLRVYQPKKVDDFGRVGFDDVSNNTSSMYRKFARTMRELELERMKVAELEKSAVDNGV